MNQLQLMEQGWRNAFLLQEEMWDRVADSINPLLFIALLGATLCLSRTSHARALRFLGRSALAVLLAFIAVKALQRLDWFEAGRAQIDGDFPSTHMAVAVSLSTSLFFAARKWLLLLPMLVFYAWLMTALRYHWWIDILGATFIAFPLTATLQVLMSRRSNARKQKTPRTLDTTSSTRTSPRPAKVGSARSKPTKSRSTKSGSTKSVSLKNAKASRGKRSKTRRF